MDRQSTVVDTKSVEILWQGVKADFLIEMYKQFANMPAYRNVDNLRLRILVYRASKYPKFTGHDAFMVDGQVQTKFVFLDWMDNVDVLDAQEQELLEAS